MDRIPYSVKTTKYGQNTDRIRTEYRDNKKTDCDNKKHSSPGRCIRARSQPMHRALLLPRLPCGNYKVSTRTTDAQHHSTTCMDGLMRWVGHEYRFPIVGWHRSLFVAGRCIGLYGITSTKLLPILACRPQIHLPTYTLTELFARPLGAARTYLPTKSASRGLYWPCEVRPTSNLPTYQKRVARPLAARPTSNLPTYQNRVAWPRDLPQTYLPTKSASRGLWPRDLPTVPTKGP